MLTGLSTRGRRTFGSRLLASSTQTRLLEMEQVPIQPAPEQVQQALNPLPDAPPAPQVAENPPPVPPAKNERAEVNDLCFETVYCVAVVSLLISVVFGFVFVSYSFR